MDTIYEGLHSIQIGDKHTWTDWKLVPASRPYVALPDPKKNTLEIPGANGVVDLSDVPVGMITYGNRSGSWEFNIAHDQGAMAWDVLYSTIASYVHGKKRRVVLTDDPSYYYEGRLTLSSFSPGEHFSSLSIGYDLAPFKKMVWTTTEDWLWNPFDLIYGVITQADFKRILVSSGATTQKVWTQNELGEIPVTPKFNVESTDGTSSMTVKVTNSFNGLGEQTFTLPYGESTKPQIMFACPNPEDTTTIKITGSGLISIDFRPGRL